MAGQHAGAPAHHTVEGTDPGLNVVVAEPESPAALPPVLLIHGFASSVALNWEQSGWISALTAAGRRVIAVDLPGHGLSQAPEDVDSYTPGRIRADLLQIVTDAGARPISAAHPGSGLDVVGYSLGSRLAWEFGATQPALVRRLVLGGPSSRDPLAEFDLPAAQRFLADGTPIADASTANLVTMAQASPGSDMYALLSLVEGIKEEPFEAAEAVPHQPMLMVSGERDERIAALEVLRGLAPSAEVLIVPGRNHVNVVTARAFKQAAIEFLTRAI
ncbi:hydrolase [Sinomonas cyclohexanicum]|uniref:Hydrolase n=1 Tax=Sinomonas cyclohexanicum TaxID=322009 RepID=A0ABN6FIY1_SINCY|nr:alpha/beta fold hydrolase [Corynebacterium cyclohexanicum]BCT76614.1 hydrolase [Corynebacterium cyclohexanicum]